MKGIITVIGIDKIGIIASVGGYLAGKRINILDISQTIVQGYFNMMMIVDLEQCTLPFEKAAEDLSALGESIGLQIKLQHEGIFSSMHRI